MFMPVGSMPVGYTPAKPHERGFARHLDWTGKYVPIVGTLVGLTRIIVAAAFYAFSQLAPLYEKKQGSDEREYRILASRAISEAKRGLWELIPGFSYLHDAEEEQRGLSEDALSLSSVARGDYFYLDPEDGLHFINSRIERRPAAILWAKVFCHDPLSVEQQTEELTLLGWRGLSSLENFIRKDFIPEDFLATRKGGI